MPERIDNCLLEWDAGIQIIKISFKTLFMRQASALQSTQLSSRPNIGQQRDVKDIFAQCHKENVVTYKYDYLTYSMLFDKSMKVNALIETIDLSIFN